VAREDGTTLLYKVEPKRFNLTLLLNERRCLVAPFYDLLFIPLMSIFRKPAEIQWPDPASNIPKPEYLCKYRVLNDYTEMGIPLLKYTRDIITSCRIWHPSPKDFNDPFDCHINIDANNTKDEIKAFVDRVWFSEVKAIRRKITTDLITNKAKFRKLITTRSRETADALPICCYGEEADNILMWSHYGDSHKGVCFKFKVANDPAFFRDIFKVKYVSKYPHFNLLRQLAEITEIVFARKSVIWAYEKEWRVFQRGKPGGYPFAKVALAEIVFGCLASPDKVAEVTALVEADPDLKHVTFKKAQLSKTDFALILKDIPRVAAP
jgi:hypothetical protein